MNLGSTIVAGNTINTGAGPDINGPVASQGSNLVGNTKFSYPANGCHHDVVTNGFTLTLDSGDGKFALDDLERSDRPPELLALFRVGEGFAHDVSCAAR